MDYKLGEVDYINALSHFPIKDCCDNSKIQILQSHYTYEPRIICLNCNSFINGKFLDTGEEIIEKWNDMIFERDRKKRTIVKVSFTDYPYPFAMI